MSTTTEGEQTDIFDELAALVQREGRRRGEKLRDTGSATADEVSSEWERDAVDAVIRHLALEGREFSANDVRLLTPELKSPRMVGARFLAASKRGVIRKTGYTTSTDPGSHAANMATWVGTANYAGKV